MSFTTLFGAITKPIGADLFSQFDDLRGDDPSPPEAIFLAAENSFNFLTESGDNFIIE
ncbi:MAG TPA: hypothetical protein VLB82_02165 [Thermodesulfobacteriota bacterium]|jgi:hypothetical protein|nr:hypothetical protein [Thermodesulfobacteriota bacterium]